MNAPVTPTCCEACGESCDALYDAPDDSGHEICGACLDAALREDDETPPFDHEHGYRRWSTP